MRISGCEERSDAKVNAPWHTNSSANMLTVLFHPVLREGIKFRSTVHFIRNIKSRNILNSIQPFIWDRIHETFLKINIFLTAIFFLFSKLRIEVTNTFQKNLLMFFFLSSFFFLKIFKKGLWGVFHWVGLWHQLSYNITANHFL